MQSADTIGTQNCEVEIHPVHLVLLLNPAKEQLALQWAVTLLEGLSLLHRRSPGGHICPA